MGAVKDHQANTSLTKLFLDGNKVGDAGAAALADALQATVLTCGQELFQSCVSCYHRCRFTKSSEELASSTCSAMCVAAFVILLVVSRRTFIDVCVARIARRLFSSVRVELDCLSSQLQMGRSPLALAWLQSATTSRHQDHGTEHETTARNDPRL